MNLYKKLYLQQPFILKLYYFFCISSNLAQFLALFSLSMVLISTVTFIVSTADELQKVDELIAFVRWMFLYSLLI